MQTSNWFNSTTRLGGDNVNNYGGVVGTDYKLVTSGGSWTHYVMVYDGTASTIDIYANNVVVSDDQFRLRQWTPPGASAAVGIGPIITEPPTQVVIGSFPNSGAGFSKSAVQTWQGLMTGSLDEIRVYSKALTAVEIGSLYQLELAGR